MLFYCALSTGHVKACPASFLPKRFANLRTKVEGFEDLKNQNLEDSKKRTQKNTRKYFHSTAFIKRGKVNCGSLSDSFDIFVTTSNSAFPMIAAVNNVDFGFFCLFS